MTSIEPEKIKQFWENRGARLGHIPYESIANLEEKPDLLQEKTIIEQQQMLPRLGLHPDMRILDLGAGVGQWTFRFAPEVHEVIAVEYAQSLVDIGRAESEKRGYKNIRWIAESAEDFVSTYAPELLDRIFISGLFVYLVDEQVSRLLSHLGAWLKPEGRIVMRDGTSILSQRHQIANRFSDILQADYSAIYRTAEEYRSLFEAAGFACLEEGQMFPEGHILNKFQETRLRYYIFKKA